MNTLALVGSSDNYTLLIVLAVIILIIVVAAIVFLARPILKSFEQAIFHNIRCGDKGAQVPLNAEIEPEEKQIPWRIARDIDVCFKELEPFQFRSQTDGLRMHGEDVFNRICHDRPDGLFMCPYTDDVGLFLVENKDAYPEAWRGKRIILPGRVFRSESDGRFWRTVEWHHGWGWPCMGKASLTELFGQNDYFLVAMQKEAPEPVPA